MVYSHHPLNQKQLQHLIIQNRASNGARQNQATEAARGIKGDVREEEEEAETGDVVSDNTESSGDINLPPPWPYMREMFLIIKNDSW